MENIWIAASDGDLASVRSWIEENESLLNAQDENGYSPLMAAVSWGHVDVVNYLLSRGANINITDMDDDGLLHVCETVEIANILITNGVNPLKPNKYDKLPIHTAFEEGVEEMVELLKPLSGEVLLITIQDVEEEEEEI